MSVNGIERSQQPAQEFVDPAAGAQVPSTQEDTVTNPVRAETSLNNVSGSSPDRLESLRVPFSTADTPKRPEPDMESTKISVQVPVARAIGGQRQRASSAATVSAGKASQTDNSLGSRNAGGAGTH